MGQLINPLQPQLPSGTQRKPGLSDTQKAALAQAGRGKNLFITGPAGVGKSFLIKELTRMFKAQHKEVALAAPTGIAAINIGGITIHSWAGVGLAQKPARDLAAFICMNKRSGGESNHKAPHAAQKHRIHRRRQF